MQNTAPLTVKHVMRDGSVGIWPARAVTSKVGSADVSPIPYASELPPIAVEFDLGDGSGVRASIKTGLIYVMNQNGKTVQTFNFGPTANEDSHLPTSVSMQTVEDQESCGS